MKALVVLNRAAGQEAHQSVRVALGRRFGASPIRYVVHETVKDEKTGEIVRARLGDGFDLVVAAGGTGRFPTSSMDWWEPRSRSESSRPGPGT